MATFKKFNKDKRPKRNTQSLLFKRKRFCRFTVTGVEEIEPPLRLALMPYVSGYLDRVPLQNGGTTYNSYFNGGMDIKWGVNEAFTVDMTLVPDFGQVVFDNQVLNLSPFEIQFNENRQFFTEGTELFNKSGLFYSRRIGIQAPFSVLNTLLNEDEYLANVPTSSQLYNATKFSGRMKNGLGIGVFNGITAPQYATAINVNDQSERSILISPITNYNVAVFDQNLKNNSFITLTNTNVWRAGSFYDANVSGLNFQLNSNNNKFALSGNSALSVKSGVLANPVGHKWGLNAAKQRGTWVGSMGYYEESDTYDPNDLGFNTNNNKRIVSGSLSYRNFKPRWTTMNRVIANLNSSYNRLFSPDVYTATYLNGSFTAVSRNFDAGGIRFNSSLTESFDYFEPRQWGAYFIRPTWTNAGVWISTNYQKRLAVDAGINYFDTAPLYGYGIAEKRLGAALNKSGKPFVLSTKVGRVLEKIDPNKKVIDACIEKGVITDWFLFAANCLRIAPPLTIREEEITKACGVIIGCLDEL